MFVFSYFNMVDMYESRDAGNEVLANFHSVRNILLGMSGFSDENNLDILERCLPEPVFARKGLIKGGYHMVSNPSNILGSRDSSILTEVIERNYGLIFSGLEDLGMGIYYRVFDCEASVRDGLPDMSSEDIGRINDKLGFVRQESQDVLDIVGRAFLDVSERYQGVSRELIRLQADYLKQWKQGLGTRWRHLAVSLESL